MRECSNAEMRDRLPDLVSGKIAPDAQAAVEAHVRECAACAEELSLLRSMRGALSRAPKIDVAAIARGVVADTSATIVDRRARVRGAPSRLRHWKIAAAFLGVAIAGITAKRITDDRAVAAHVLASLDTNPPGTSANPAHPAQTPTVTGTAGASIDVPADTRDLSTDDLQQLLNEVQTMDAVPASEPSELVTPPDGGGAL